MNTFIFAKTNVIGTLLLLQAAKLYWELMPERYLSKRFYHISIDAVYGALELTHPEGIENTERWYLDNQEWLDNDTSGDYQK